MNVRKSERIIGVFLHMYRVETAMKEETLARELGISTGYLSLIENFKRKPTLNLVKKIASRFHLCVACLIGEDCEHYRLHERQKVINENDVTPYAEYLLTRCEPPVHHQTA